MTGGGPLNRVRALPGRLSIRVRLTLVYSGLFFVLGVALLTVTYVVVGKILDQVVVSPPGATVLDPDDLQRLVRELTAQYRAQVLSTLLRQELLVLVLVGVCAVLLGYAVADRALSPLSRVTTLARELSESTLHERIQMEGPSDEIKELADTFDAMLGRLQWAFDTQRRFVASASHELRTPLAINRTLLEVALGDPDASPDLKAVGRTLLATNARHERLIEGLLLLARSERAPTGRVRVDLAEVAGSALAAVTAEAESAHVAVSSELTAVDTYGDPVLLERLISNLLDNAVRHNDAEDPMLWLRTGMIDGSPTVQVSNTGPQIAPYEVDGLFRAFHKRRSEPDSETKDSGAGLGLSIVASIARAHGGTAFATPRPGGGLVVTVRLPPLRSADGVVSSGRPERASRTDRY